MVMQQQLQSKAHRIIEYERVKCGDGWMSADVNAKLMTEFRDLSSADGRSQ